MRIVVPLVFAVLAAGQSAAPSSFEAASIKPSQAPPGSSGINTNGSLMRAYNVTLKRCISGAYGVPESQITGGPKWIDELRFDITAKPDRQVGDDGMMLMLRSLMADRFSLQVHQDTQTLSGYALTVVKGGIRATLSAPDGPATTNTGRNRIDAKGCPMSRLVIKLSGVLGGVPVVDMTNDNRNFDFSLQWAPEEMQSKSGAQAAVPDGPSLFTALQEQLGLKLEGRKVPVGIVVVDHAELPSEN
jgi:uncharacterized protein (TIGR03435 family)